MFNSKKNIEILTKAFEAIAAEEAKTFPTYDECKHITFSAEFERKMQRLINMEKKPYYYLINTVGKRVACIVIAALIALTSITFGVKAIREAVIDFFVETFEKFSIVGFKDEDIPENNKTIETYYAPTYIPEGYELKKDKRMVTYRRMRYESNEGYIEFNQDIMQGISTYIDTEDAETESISVLGYKAFYSNKDEMFLIYWNDSHYSYAIQTESGLKKEEVIKIAESIVAEQFVTLCRIRSFNRLKETL